MGGVVSARTLGLVAGAVFSVRLAVRLTPPQQIPTGGQTVRLPVTGPWAGWTGPGTLVLVGQDIPTAVALHGPLRPRPALTEIRFGRELDRLVREPDGSVAEVGRRLAEGWFRHALWETVIAVGVTLVILASAAVLRRLSVRSAVTPAGAGLLLTSGPSATGYLVLADDTPKVLRSVGSPEDLVDRAPPAPLPPPEGPVAEDVRLVVLGDSTAAGSGTGSLEGPRVPTRFRGVLRVPGAPAGPPGAQPRLRGGDRQGRSPGSPYRRRNDGPATACRGAVGARGVGGHRQHRRQRRPVGGTHPAVHDAAAVRGPRHGRVPRRTARPFLPGLPGAAAPSRRPPRFPASSSPSTTPPSTTPSTTRRTASARRASRRPDFTGHGLCTDRPYVRGPAEQAPPHPTGSGQLTIARRPACPPSAAAHPGRRPYAPLSG